MRKTRVVFLIICLTFFITVLMGFTSQPVEKKQNMFEAIGVVELFTSEGCSSCPPADEAVASLAKQNNKQVYILCFHVDYWDRLGWKDAFSKAVYSNRQKDYAAAFKSDRIYTPQIIVNGKTEFVGSDRNVLINTLEKELKIPAENSIELSAQVTGKNQIAIAYKIKNPVNTNLSIALVQQHAITSVKAGENEGKKLQHINIVRNFETIVLDNKIAGTLNLEIPRAITAKDCKVIAFTQLTNSMHITAAKEIVIKPGGQ